jgi:ABC-type multidrug transport system ATPase subunit
MSEAITAIEVRGVTCVFGATAALRGISCRFEAGTLTFVQGSNGAGKSTLLGILATVLRATGGSVRYAPIGTDRLAARSQIGWVAHDSHCYRDLTGRENVEFAARLYGANDAKKVAAVAERVGATPFFDQAVGTLSRGQRQRISLARALVHSPSVLLLDEPLSGLDRASVARFEEIVVAERDAGKVVIVVSHRDEWVRRLAGRRLVLERGQIASDD